MDSLLKRTNEKLKWRDAFSHNLVRLFTITYDQNPSLRHDLKHLIDCWNFYFSEYIIKEINDFISPPPIEKKRARIEERSNYRRRSSSSNYHSNHYNSYRQYRRSSSPSSVSRSPAYDPTTNIPYSTAMYPSPKHISSIHVNILSNIPNLSNLVEILNPGQTHSSSNMQGAPLGISLDSVGGVLQNSLSPSQPLNFHLSSYVQFIQFSMFVTPHNGKNTSQTSVPMSLSQYIPGLHEALYVCPILCSDCGARFEKKEIHFYFCFCLIN